MTAPHTDVAPATKKSGLTIGDALVIVALLIFIIGWSAGSIWVIRTSQPPEPGEASDLAGFIIFATYFGPPIWAGYTISKIINRR